MIDFNETDGVEKYLEGSKITKMIGSTEGLEGGLVIVFEKNWKAGIYIMGYTEIGKWVYHFEHGENVYIDKYELEVVNKVRLNNGFSVVKKEEKNTEEW